MPLGSRRREPGQETDAGRSFPVLEALNIRRLAVERGRHLTLGLAAPPPEAGYVRAQALQEGTEALVFLIVLTWLRHPLQVSKLCLP